SINHNPTKRIATIKLGYIYSLIFIRKYIICILHLISKSELLKKFYSGFHNMECREELKCCVLHIFKHPFLLTFILNHPLTDKPLINVKCLFTASTMTMIAYDNYIVFLAVVIHNFLNILFHKAIHFKNSILERVIARI